MTGYIYKITSPTSKIYIGQTLDVTKRQSQYRKLDCKGQVRLYHSLKKYGWDAHIFEVICECSADKLNETERYYQDYYNVLADGLNCKLTTSLSKTGQLSEETKSRIGISNRGKVRSVEAKDRVSKGLAGRPKSEEHKQKLRQALLGRTHSLETVKKIQASRKYGVDHPMYGKKRPDLSERNSKPCIIDGVHYSSAKEAATILGMKRDKICRRLNSSKYTNYNYC